MTDRPYTDKDLRAEAARLHARAARNADDGIRPAVERKWGDAGLDEIDEACDTIVSLLDGAVDVSRWAVDLGVAGLTETVSHGWHCTTTGWDLAIQIADHPQTKPELRAQVKAAVVAAVDRVLAEHGLTPRTGT